MTSTYLRAMPEWQPVAINSGKRHRKKTLSEQVRIGYVTLSMVMIFLICVMGLQILHCTHNNQAKGYAIEQTLREITDLKIVNDTYREKIAHAKSLDEMTAQDNSVLKTMVAVDEIQHIKTDNGVQVASQ